MRITDEQYKAIFEATSKAYYSGPPQNTAWGPASLDAGRAAFEASVRLAIEMLCSEEAPSGNGAGYNMAVGRLAMLITPEPDPAVEAMRAQAESWRWHTTDDQLASLANIVREADKKACAK